MKVIPAIVLGFSTLIYHYNDVPNVIDFSTVVPKNRIDDFSPL